MRQEKQEHSRKRRFRVDRLAEAQGRLKKQEDSSPILMKFLRSQFPKTRSGIANNDPLRRDSVNDDEVIPITFAPVSNGGQEEL